MLASGTSQGVSSKHVNQNVCENQDFWRSLLYKKYPSVLGFKSSNYKKLYKFLRETIVSESIFNKPVFISQNMVDFLRNIDFGSVFISEVLNLLLQQGILTRPALTILLTLYLRKIKVGTFLEVDDNMNKYLGHTLTELEKEGKFDRNSFHAGNIKRIIGKNILKNGDKQILASNKTLANKITRIVNDFSIRQQI